MADQVSLELAPKAVPAAPICFAADRSGAPCRYAVVCPEMRQRIQHHQALRGEMCWAFNLHQAREARHLPVLP